MPLDLHPENLIKLKDLPPERQKEIRSMGGKASQVARKKRKAQKEALDALLSLKVKDPQAISKLQKLGIKKSDMNNQELILVAMMLKACKGDVKAAKFIRDTLGENPNKIQVEFDSSGTTEAILLKLAERNNGFDEDEELNVRQDTDNSNG